MKIDKQTDAQLVEAYKSGNKDALATLVKRWHFLFCKKAFFIIKDADLSKDIAQETWQVIISNINTLKDASSFSSWALRIIPTKAIDYIKQKNEIKYRAPENIKQPVIDDDRKVIKKALLKAIKKLSKEKQDVIRLF